MDFFWVSLPGPRRVLLPDELVEGARAHAYYQGGFRAHALLMGVGEEAHQALSVKGLITWTVP